MSDTVATLIGEVRELRLEVAALLKRIAALHDYIASQRAGSE